VPRKALPQERAANAHWQAKAAHAKVTTSWPQLQLKLPYRCSQAAATSCSAAVATSCTQAVALSLHPSRCPIAAAKQLPPAAPKQPTPRAYATLPQEPTRRAYARLAVVVIAPPMGCVATGGVYAGATIGLTGAVCARVVLPPSPKLGSGLVMLEMSTCDA